MTDLISQLQSNYPDIHFAYSNNCSWSYRKQQVSHRGTSTPEDTWSLFHELGHALLRHSSYNTDIELLKKEMRAWQEAIEIAKNYAVTIDQEFIEDCLDSYRDWIFKRSACPTCRAQGIQKTIEQYYCLNCKNTWEVTKSRLCRPYRRSKKDSAILRSLYDEL